MSSPLEAGRPTPETLKAFANLLTLKDDFFKRVQRVQPMVQQWDLTADEIALFSRGGLTSLVSPQLPRQGIRMEIWKDHRVTPNTSSFELIVFHSDPEALDTVNTDIRLYEETLQDGLQGDEMELEVSFHGTLHEGKWVRINAPLSSTSHPLSTEHLRGFHEILRSVSGRPGSSM